MASIPLPTGIKGLEDFPRQQESLTNLFTNDGIIKRPGISEVVESFGRARGVARFMNRLFMVSGEHLIEISSSGDVTDHGEIPGITRVIMSPGQTQMVILIEDGAAYVFDTALNLLSSSNYQDAKDVAYIDGRFVFIPRDGGPAFYTDVLNAQSIQAANFFDAETSPDENSGIINLNQTLWLLGRDSLEPFRNIGPVATPFLRSTGGVLPAGYVSSRVEIGGGFAFLGKNKDGGFAYMFVGGGRLQTISNSAIDELLADEYSLAELERGHANYIYWKGANVASFHLPRHTLYFVNGEWSYTSSGVNGMDNPSTWRANYIVEAYGKFYCGDSNTAKIGTLEDIEEDFGDKFEFGFETFIRSERGVDFSLASLELDCLVGRSNPAGEIGLRISQDGRLYGNAVYVSLWHTGHYKNKVQFRYPGGLGSFESFAGIRIFSTSSVDFAADGLYGDIQ